MTAPALPPVETIRALVGHEFPGGKYTIAHWENFLLTECTGSAPLPGHIAHPVALFHVPILGAGTSIGEMFALGQAESDSSIGIESYDWEIRQALEEDVEYTISGKVTEADRRTTERGTADRIQFRFDLALPDGRPAASSTITWLYRRSAK
jgi:hypothetical protein